MHARTPLFLALGLLVGAAPAAAATYPGGSFGFANNSCGSSQLVVGDDFPVAAVRLVVDIDHDAAQELEMTLEYTPPSQSPTGAMFSDNPAFIIPWRHNDYAATIQGSYGFRDDAATNWADAVAANQLSTVPPGSYVPDAAALNSLAGSSGAGTWRLVVCDLSGSGTAGTVNSWTLELVEAPQPVPAASTWARGLLALALGGALALRLRA